MAKLNPSMIFPNIPLYSTLKNKIKQNQTGVPDENEKNEIVSKTVKLLKSKNEQTAFNDQEMLYALIKAYSIDTDHLDIDLPYDIKITKLGLKIDIDLLPTQLQWILLYFLRQVTEN
jgi:hypothetical protein